MPIEEALSRAKQQQDAMPKSKAEAKQIWEESRSIQKHAMHDQKTHGNWATGGSGLNIEEAMALQKRSDPLKTKVYAAENSLLPKKEKTKAPDYPKLDDFPSREDFDKAYKAYNKKWLAWVVDEQANIVSKTGAELLDGTPAGVKKYVEKIIKEDWFIEAFGDGSSLPKLEVKVGNASAAGRHIMSFQKDRSTGRIVKTRHELALDRQFTKDETAILHEISHYATAISQREKYDAHGVEFARNHVFIAGKVAGSAGAEALDNAYQENGVRDGD
jgi:hypothetical protein